MLNVSTIYLQIFKLELITPKLKSRLQMSLTLSKTDKNHNCKQSMPSSEKFFCIIYKGYILTLLDIKNKLLLSQIFLSQLYINLECKICLYADDVRKKV